MLTATSVPKMQGGLTTNSKKLDNFIKDAAATSVAIGFFEDSVYPSGVQVGRIARVQDFGWLEKNIPPTAFMRNAIEEITPVATQLVGSLAVNAIAGNARMSDVFDDLGNYGKRVVQQSIESVFSPPLADSTLAARRRRGNFSEKRLEDTGHMKNSVRYEVSS